MSLPKGHFSKLLAMDCETSGMEFNFMNPAEGYQALSWGLVVADAKTFKPIDELYIEIQWDGHSKWDKKAEVVHGLSKEYLKANGMSKEDAVATIFEFVNTYWPRDSELSSGRNVRCLGQNVATFDIWFMRQMFDDVGASELMFPTGARFIDTSSVGFVALETFNSDDLFETVGVRRKEHNALEDAKAALSAMKMVRHICNSAIEG